MVAASGRPGGSKEASGSIREAKTPHLVYAAAAPQLAPVSQTRFDAAPHELRVRIEYRLPRRADLARMVTKRARARLSDAGAFAQDVMEVRDPALLNALLAEQSSAADQATLVFASPDFQWR